MCWYFNRGPVPYGGERHTINNGWFGLASPFATNEISSYRFIADMADPALVCSTKTVMSCRFSKLGPAQILSRI